MMNKRIPKQLQNSQFRFILIKRKSKLPLEKQWQSKNNYTWDDKKLQKHIESGGNYAIINKSGSLIVIDADDPKISLIATDNLPKTFAVQTSKVGKNHIYYYCKNSIIAKLFFKDKMGDIRGYSGNASNYYTICPNSIHPSGIEYKVIVDTDIAEIDEKQLLETYQSLITTGYGKVKNTLDGVKKGNRDNTLFKFACKLRDDNYNYEDALILVIERGKRCTPLLNKEECIKCAKSAYRYIKDGEKTTLQNVYDVFEKWLFIQDKNRIDTILAVAISNQIKGTPIWLFFVGASGDSKTEVSKSLNNLQNVQIIDQLTPNSFASGKQGAEDLGEIMQDKSTILMILDLASLITAHKDEKKTIFGQLRTLYDGDIYKRTGSGLNKAYKNCHVTLIANVTDAIRVEQHIHQQLGTRELLYDTDRQRSDDREKLKMAWKNENYEKQMREEINMAVCGFIYSHPIKNIDDSDIPPKIEDFIYDKVLELRVLRASANIDWKTSEVTTDVSDEVPTRTTKQFKRLYKSLKSLDDDYPDEKTMEIINHIVKSSGNPIRRKIMDIFDMGEKDEYTTAEIAEKIRIAYLTAKRELSILWNLRWLNRDVRIENVGGFHGDDNVIRGGKWQEVAYYRKAEKNNIQTGLEI